MHVNLGHPNPKRPADELKDQNYSQEHLHCVRDYACDEFYKARRPRLHKAARIADNTHFNYSISVDTFFALYQEEPNKILSILDDYSRYEVDAEINQETARRQIDILETQWRKHFCAP